MSNAIERLETLQKQFLALSEPFLVKIGNERLPPDFPADLAHIFPIVESGPWHYAGNPDELKDGFLLHAETAARLAGYRGDRPITHWLDRICPTGEKHDLRQASAIECQRLINDALANSGTDRHPGSTFVSRNIRFLRERCALTQEELAERIHASRRSIHEHESGGKEPRAYMLRQYTDFFSRELGQKITIEDLVSRDLTTQRVTQESHERPTAATGKNSNLKANASDHDVTADLHDGTKSPLSETQRYRTVAQLQGFGSAHGGVRGDSSSAKNSWYGTTMDPNRKTHSISSKGRE